MSKWPDNEARYEARLRVFGYLCVNFWKFLEEKEDGEPVVKFTSTNFGDIPEEYMRYLTHEDESVIRTIMIKNFFTGKNKLTGYNIDDFLSELQWAFNSNDIEGLKIVFKAPHVRKKYK